MADQTTYDTVATVDFKNALHNKAQEVLSTLDTLEVQASPITFQVNAIDVAMSWGTRDIHFTIAGDAYDYVIPLAWITATP